MPNAGVVKKPRYMDIEGRLYSIISVQTINKPTGNGNPKEASGVGVIVEKDGITYTLRVLYSHPSYDGQRVGEIVIPHPRILDNKTREDLGRILREYGAMEVDQR